MTAEGDNHLTAGQQPPKLSGAEAAPDARSSPGVPGDSGEPVLPTDVPGAPSADSFSHWIGNRLLTPEELAGFEEEDGA